MKITCVAGSARTNGTCAYIVDAFIKGVKENNDDIEIKRYNISTSKINFCLGCKECYKNGVCVQNDDVQIIADDILSSDIAPACRISICETDSLSDLKKKHIDKIKQVYDIGKNIKCL